MGLFDNNPESMSQLGMIAGLLNAKKGDNWGLLLQNQAQQMEQRRQRALQEQVMRQQMEARNFDLQAAQRGMAEQQQKRDLATKAFAPNRNVVPGDDEGNVMPPSGGGGIPEYVQGLLGMGDVQGAMGIQAGMQKQGPKYHVVNGALVPEPSAPGQQSQPVYKAPDKVPDWQDPRYVEVQKSIRAAGRPQVNVNTREETEFAKTIGKKHAESYDDVLKGGMSAQSRIKDMQRFEAITSKVPTGKLEPIKAEVAKLANGLGVKVDTEKLGFQEALESLSNQYALTLRNPTGGAGMPGALSDKDREFLTNMVPGLAKTPAGNKLIIEGFRRVAQREIEVAALAREYKAKTGKFDDGFYAEVERRFGGNDLLGDLFEKASAQGAQNVPMSSSDPLGIRR